MAVNDVYEVKVSQNIPQIADEALNVFFYRNTAGSPDLGGFIDAFTLNVLLPMRICQSDQMYYNYVQVTNLYDLDEFFVRSYDVDELQGDYAGTAAPPSTAINFTLKRTSRTVRNGSKRLAGIPNAEVNEGIIDNGAYLLALNDIATGFSEELTDAIGGAVFKPVIVGRVKTANPDYPDNSKYPFKYTLPTAVGQSPVVDVGQTTFSIYPSTQVSRKTNR